MFGAWWMFDRLLAVTLCKLVSCLSATMFRRPIYIRQDIGYQSETSTGNQGTDPINANGNLLPSNLSPAAVRNSPQARHEYDHAEHGGHIPTPAPSNRISKQAA